MFLKTKRVAGKCIGGANSAEQAWGRARRQAKAQGIADARKVEPGREEQRRDERDEMSERDLFGSKCAISPPCSQVGGRGGILMLDFGKLTSIIVLVLFYILYFIII